MIIGASLKTYFGHADAVRWTEQIARAVEQRPRVAEVFVLPAFPSLIAVGETLRGTGIGYGAQDLAASDDGAQTGEVTGSVLAEVGCRYAEVGHAERRRGLGETESVVSAKTAAALRHGLTPVLCIGEPDRTSAVQAAEGCVRQLHTALADARSAGLGGRMVVAYEPHWAIGAPAPAPVDHVTTVCAALRQALADLDGHPGSAVIYGGSAGPGLLATLGEHVDGLFLGRLVHDPAAFAAVLDEAVVLAQSGARS